MKVDPHTLADLISSQPSKNIYINVYDGELFLISHLELLRAKYGNSLKGNKIVKYVSEPVQRFIDELDSYQKFYKPTEGDLKGIINRFVKDHPQYDGYDIGKPALTKFVRVSKTIGLYDEWVEYLSLFIAQEVHDELQYFELDEDETNPQIYRQITDELVKIRENHYEQRYSDKNLFIISYEQLDYVFIFLGNAGIVTGISFYINEHPIDTHRTVYISNDSFPDIDTFSTTQGMMSFYFEDKRNDAYLNPYSDDHLITSIYLSRGNIHNNYLPLSLSLYLLLGLRVINRYFNDIDNSDIYEDEISETHIYIHNDDKVASITCRYSDEEYVPNDFYYLLREYYLPELEIGEIDKNLEVDLAVRKVPDYVEDEKDERIAHFGYLLLVNDHKTGMVLNPIMGNGPHSHPFEELITAIVKMYRKGKFPKKIHVNNLIDFYVADSIASAVKSRSKIKVTMVNRFLSTDEAFTGLVKALKNAPYDDDKFDA